MEELGKPLGISTPAVMKHLSVLERSGLISTRKVGRRRLSRLKPDRLQQAESWINEARMFWEDVLTQLAAHVEGTEND